jgi:Zn-dependent protease with chaperone function
MGAAQLSPDYRAITDNPGKQKQLQEAISGRFQQDQASLAGKNKKYIAEIYKERYEMIKKKVDDRELITNIEVQEYLNKLVKEITSKNKNIVPADVRIHFSRSSWPNASSMGEGTIIFNIGLFSRLQNEAQAAFVIAHELAHYYLNHSNNSIQRYVETVNSGDFQKQLKEIRSSQYGQNSALEKLALNLSFGSRRHSRAFEKAADSMAIELMRPTLFDLNEALTTLALLDSVDKDKYQAELKLEEVFNFPGYPFKKKWVASGGLSFTDSKEDVAKKKSLDDSLKTHPDCSHRINLLSPKVQKYRSAESRTFVINEHEFNRLKKQFDFEILEYEFESNEVSRCLYQSLQMLHYDRDNPYLMAMVGKCLNRMYTAQVAHELGKIVDLPNPQYDSEYNTLLRLIQNLRLTELASVTYYYLKSHQESGKVSEEYIAALIKSKDNFGKPEEKQEWINYYQSHFQKRKYNF